MNNTKVIRCDCGAVITIVAEVKEDRASIYGFSVVYHFSGMASFDQFGYVQCLCYKPYYVKRWMDIFYRRAIRELAKEA